MTARNTAYRRTFDAWSQGEHAYALELSRELVRGFPDYSVGWVLHGVILYGLARYEEAEQVLREAIQGLDLDELSFGYIHLGHLHRDRGNYEEAEKWYRKAIELSPDDAGRHTYLGALLAVKGDFKGAEESHRKGTRCSKGTVDEAYLNLGFVLRAQERYSEALDCFNKALQLTADYKEAKLAKSDMEKVIALLQTMA